MRLAITPMPRSIVVSVRGAFTFYTCNVKISLKTVSSTKLTIIPIIMINKRIFYPSLCILATAVSLNAQEVVPVDWNSANADGDWNTPESWDLGVLPTATDFARINGGNAFLVVMRTN